MPEVLGSRQQSAMYETYTFGSVIESLSRWTVRSQLNKAKSHGSLLVGSRKPPGSIAHSNNLVTTPLKCKVFMFRTTDKME